MAILPHILTISQHRQIKFLQFWAAVFGASLEDHNERFTRNDLKNLREWSVKCWELRCCPRQPPPVTQPWLHTDCWRGFKPLVPSDKRFNHSKVWCTFISSSTSTVYAVQVCECYNINSYWYFYFLKYNTLGLQYCITTTLLYFTTVLHLLHLLHLSISSDRCNRCNPIVLQYCCCCEGGD